MSPACSLPIEAACTTGKHFPLFGGSEIREFDDEWQYSVKVGKERENFLARQRAVVGSNMKEARFVESVSLMQFGQTHQ